ncbi:MAG: DUF502 domain-containing protein, partial [Planctomycetaceae bacterium]|nr:DUF502 domain-containing protein [Planctomycetaceae bacterium]
MGKPFEKVQQRVIRCFLAGVFALLPVIITVAVVVWVTDFLERFIGPKTVIGEQLSKLGLQFADDPSADGSSNLLSYAIGWIIVLAAVFCLGIVIEMGARNRIKKLVDAILSRVPLVGKIYSSSRQVVDMLDKTDDQNLQGMKPVFCYFGQQNPTVFLALLVSPKQFRLNEIDYCIVIVPTAPVPFGGGLLFVPAPCVKEAPLSVD